MSVVKWSPYNVGGISTLIMKEINKLVANKEYRKKLGLEKGVYAEFKGNTHWNLFIAVQLAEVITKRINDDMKNVFIQYAHGLNTSSNYLNNLAQQLQKAEFDINNATTLASNNVIKSLKSDLNKIAKISNKLSRINTDLETKTASLKTDIEDTSTQINERLTEGFQNVLKELENRSETSKKEITDDIMGLREFSDEKFKETAEMFANKIGLIEKNLVDLQERVSSFQEANNNMLDDQTNAVVTEFQEGIGSVMKQNLENVETIRRNNEEFKNQTVTLINDTTDTLSSNLESTNQHLDEVNQNVNEIIKQTELQFSKELKTEITDVRNILSAIRSDIELMKSVLTKLDSKIH
jgi:hypothetical protein